MWHRETNIRTQMQKSAKSTDKRRFANGKEITLKRWTTSTRQRETLTLYTQGNREQVEAIREGQTIRPEEGKGSYTTQEEGNKIK